MQDRTFSAVIPLIPAHHTYIDRLLSELETSTKKFDEIWIIASSQNRKSTEQLESIIDKYDSSKIKTVISNLPRSAGENRNIGFDKVTSDYICFLDADDSYSPHRLEILDKVIALTGAELIYHDYFRLLPKVAFKLNKSIDMTSLATMEELASASFSDEGIKKNLDITKGGYTNLLLPHRLRRMHRIQHGHVTVSSRISERFSSMTVGEDGEFARRCLRNCRNVIYIPQRLSIYDRATPSNLYSSFFGRTLNTLTRFKFKLLSKATRRYPL